MSDSQPSSDPLTDHQLLERTAHGDTEAFGLLVDRHHPRIFRFARTMAGRLEDAEDIVQQTFLAAWRGAATFRGDASVLTWLLTIARHTAWRATGSRAHAPVDDTALEILAVEAGWGAASPEWLAIERERRDLVRQAFERLAPADRAVLVLRDLDGCSGQEAADVLGLGLPNLKSRLHRARLRLAAEVRRLEGRDVGRRS